LKGLTKAPTLTWISESLFQKERLSTFAQQVIRFSTHPAISLNTWYIDRLTERKQLDEERERLLASERAAFAEAVAAQQRFRDLVNSVEGIVWEADVPSFRFSFISEQAERVLGTRWTAGCRTDILERPRPSRRPRVDPPVLQNATAEKRDHQFEYAYRCRRKCVWLRTW